MVKILLADTDTKRNSASYQFLSNEKDFEIESTNDGISTIKKYLEIEPNIFVIDSNFTDIKTLDIIDRLSVSPLERRKKNTILTISETKETFLLENVLKVYQVLYRPYLILFHVFLNFPLQILYYNFHSISWLLDLIDLWLIEMPLLYV